MRRLLLLFLIFFNVGPCLLSAQDAPAASSAPSSGNPFAKYFYLNADQRTQADTYLVDGFAFVETPDRDLNTRYSVVTDFGKTMVKTQYVRGLQSIPDIKKWIQDNAESSEYEGVEIRRLKMPSADKTERMLYWVGHKGFHSLEKAKQEIAQIKSLVETQGGDLRRMVREAQDAFALPEEETPQEIKQAKANQQKEEELVLKMLDKMEFGDKLFGPFEGSTTGEPIIWRSFGETSWRQTALDVQNYSSQLGYWTNQIVFQGFKFPLNTVNPYVEVTNDFDGTGVDYKSKMLLNAGLEWRPLQRNAFLYNFRPWGIPLLQWIRNYRFFIQYGNRKNLKDEITGSKSHELEYGLSIFYEWGIDLPPIEQAAPYNFSEYLEQYIWGEYFGQYKYQMTGYSAEEDYHAVLANSAVILGFKTPAVPLPPNPLMDELMLMPYLKFQHAVNDEFSFPYTNNYMVSAGVRWMPFRSYRFKENEWLSKVKIFGEYVGIGDVHHVKQDGEAPYAITHDWIVGVNISSKRN